MNARNWKKQIPVCLGTVDLKWGGLTLDDVRCKELLKTAMEEGATMDDIVAETREYLEVKGATPQHIDLKVDQIKNLTL